MAYIGKAPVNGFHSKQSLTGDGSTTSFALDFTVANTTSLIVSVGGVLQEVQAAIKLRITIEFVLAMTLSHTLTFK